MVELVAPYVPCRRWRYSLSYPYRTSPLRALRAAIELRDWEPEPSRVWIFGSQRRGTTWVRPASGCHHSVYLTYGDHTLWIFRKCLEFRRYRNTNVFYKWKRFLMSLKTYFRHILYFIIFFYINDFDNFDNVLPMCIKYSWYTQIIDGWCVKEFYVPHVERSKAIRNM